MQLSSARSTLRKFALSIGGLLLVASGSAFAQQADDDPQQLIDTFVKQHAEQHDVSVAQVKQWLGQAERNQQVLDAIQRPWEAKPWFQYYPIFLTDKRLTAGLRFWQTHADTLARAEQQFGVPAEIIVAIIGIETFYGEYLGKYSVLDSLYTLAFYYPPRARFFRSELSEYLQLAAAEQWPVKQQKGSYAGAMGLGQFISSSYRHYAVDFDDDGQRNIISNPVDAIGSVANYFSEHRWQAGQPIAHKPEQQQAWQKVATDGMKPDTTVGKLRQEGYQIDSLYRDDMPVKVLALETENGHEYWLGFDNFYAITRYNHSPLYAMVAYQLSQQLAAKAP